MKKNYLYALLTVFIWSTMAAVTKMLLLDIPNMEALSLSSYLGFVFLLLVNIKNKSIRKVRDYSFKDYGIMAGLGFIGMFLYSALYYYGLTMLTSQEACIVNYLWPIMLVLFSCIILKEKMTMMKGVAMLCSFLGIVILSAGGSAASGGNAWKGIVSCVIAAACYGLFSVLNKKADYDQNICMMVIWLLVAVCSMVFGLATETWIVLSAAQWLGMFWLGAIVDALAYLLWALALQGTHNTAVIANIAFLTPFLSLVISAVLLKEQLHWRVFLALVFIVGGILLQSIFDSKQHE